MTDERCCPVKLKYNEKIICKQSKRGFWDFFRYVKARIKDYFRGYNVVYCLTTNDMETKDTKFIHTICFSFVVNNGEVCIVNREDSSKLREVEEC